MKLTVWLSSTPLLSLLTPAQKTLIENINPKFSPDNIFVFQVMTTWETVYFENWAVATTTDWFPLEQGGGSLNIAWEWFTDLNVIGSEAGIDLRVLPM